MASFSVRKAHKTQLSLSHNIIRKDNLPSKITSVAGVDVSYVADLAVGSIVVLDYDSLEVLEAKTAVCPVKMPYIPTLLSFRELPPAMAAIKKLRTQTDVFLVDSQGLAHPYRCGFASHLGLALGKPTIGAAKSRLVGEEVSSNGRILLTDEEEVIGEAVTTKLGSKPIYVSVGHMVSLKTAVRIVQHCSKNRIPEPLLLAHTLAAKERARIAEMAK